MHLVFSILVKIVVRRLRKGLMNMSKKEKMKKMAEDFLWANAGDSVGCYGGGKRVFKKMPWYKMMQGS